MESRVCLTTMARFGGRMTMGEEAKVAIQREEVDEAVPDLCSPF